MVHDRDRGMRCQYCVDAGKTNAFTNGCALTIDHKASIEAKSGRRDMQQALARAYKDNELAVIAALRTVFHGQEKSP